MRRCSTGMMRKTGRFLEIVGAPQTPPLNEPGMFCLSIDQTRQFLLHANRDTTRITRRDDLPKLESSKIPRSDDFPKQEGRQNSRSDSLPKLESLRTWQQLPPAKLEGRGIA